MAERLPEASAGNGALPRPGMLTRWWHATWSSLVPPPSPRHKLPRLDQGTSSRGRWLARARIATQLVSFGLFLVLLLKTEVTSFGRGVDLSHSGVGWSVHDVLKADPLLGLATLLSTWNLYDGLIWGLAILLITLALGRVACGWLCPFGALQHFVEWVGRGWRRAVTIIQGNRYRPSMKLKFYLLAGLLVSALFTTMLVGLFDPISLLTRSLGLSIIPAINEGVRSLASQLQATGWAPLQFVAAGLEVIRPHLLPVRTTHIQGAWLLGVLFLGLVVAVVWLPRFWCRHLCPLGALLGLCSRPALLQLVKKDSKCTHCNRCLLACQGGCEPQGGVAWRQAECHTCFNCEAACPEGALSFRLLPAADPVHQRGDADLSRRTLLGSLATGAAALPLLRSSAGFAGQRGEGVDPTLIRPPGAQAEDEFLARCIKCGACMKVCPTGALHPTLAQAGLEGLWTPTLVARIGYCEPSCTLCGQVCPTGAIRRLTEAEKTGHDGQPPIRIGMAFYDHGRCLPWALDTPCIVCEEWCPVSPKAIWLEPVTVTGRDGQPLQLQRPHVDPRRCTGCGACEYACPVKDLPAIRISSAGETRHPHNRFLLTG